MKQIFILSILLSFIGGFKVAEKMYRPETQSELVRKVNRAVTEAECTTNVHKYIYKQYQRQVLDEYVALLNFIINTNMSDEKIIEHNGNIRNKLKNISNNMKTALDECYLKLKFYDK